MWYVNILRKNTSVQKCCKQKLKLVFNEETCTDELKQVGSVGGATSPPAVTAFLRKPPDRRRSPVNAAAPSGESVCSQWPELLQARDQRTYKHTQPWANTLKLTAQILSEIIFLVVSNSPDGAGTVRGGADARPDVVVVALVLVLLLTPHKISVWKTIWFCFHQVERERWELREKDIWRQECCEVFEWNYLYFTTLSGLYVTRVPRHQLHLQNTLSYTHFDHTASTPCRYLFDADNSHGVVHPSVLALSGQFVVDLAGAENDSLHLLWAGSCRPVVWDYTLEVRPCRMTNTNSQ